MNGNVAMHDSAFETSETALACGVRELDITLIRATNYTDDGYPITMKVGVIRSNTLTQMGTLARDLTTLPVFRRGGPSRPPRR